LSAQGKMTPSNSLTISSAKLQELGLENKLYGPTGSTGKESVYVTRDQMASLAAEMYSTLNIVEDYEMPETQFTDAFVDELVRQMSTQSFAMVPIDEALASLSKYEYDVSGDLRADEIKRDLGEILVIEKIGNKGRIVNNRSRSTSSENSQDQRASGSVGVGYGPFSVQTSFEYGKSNAQKSYDEIKSLDDQLHDLNRESSNLIKWEIEGNRVIPKWLNVARLSRSRASTELRFSRISRFTFDAPFKRRFGLHTDNTRFEAPLKLFLVRIFCPDERVVV
jgi:hypothetical protein